MADRKSKILVLVEGEKTDYRLMQHLIEVYGISDRHEIVSYNTNIYALYQDMFREGDPDSIDLLQNLKEHEKDCDKKRIFDQRFSDILLIFDLDPQDSRFSSEIILAMANYFTESSDMGKLYINYPMVESFYHMKRIPDPDYNSYSASLLELRQHKYKQRVNRENRDHSYSKFAASRSECTCVIRQNIEKAWWLIGELKPNDSQAYSSPDTLEVLKKQLAMLDSISSVSVLCTCVFYISDYNPAFLQ